MCAGSKTLDHAGGKGQVDSERITRAGGEESARYRIEDGGVDQAVAGAEVVVGNGEIAPLRKHSVGKRAQGCGSEGLALGSQQQAGGRWVVQEEFVGVEVVGSGKHPGGRSGRGGRVGGEAEVGRGGRGRHGVGGGDVNVLIGEGCGKVGECGFEGFGGKRGEADEEAAGWRARCRLRGVVRDGGGRGHWAVSGTRYYLPEKVTAGPECRPGESGPTRGDC